MGGPRPSGWSLGVVEGPLGVLTEGGPMPPRGGHWVVQGLHGGHWGWLKAPSGWSLGGPCVCDLCVCVCVCVLNRHCRFVAV